LKKLNFNPHRELLHCNINVEKPIIAQPASRRKFMAQHMKSRKSSFRSSNKPPKLAPVEVTRHSIDSAQDALAKTRVAGEEASKGVVEAYAAGAGGASHLGLHLIEIARANTNAAFDLGRQLMTAKTLSEMFELSAVHTRRQLERFAEESRQVPAMVQQALAKFFSPLQASVAKVGALSAHNPR
jgi:hypothetical protein